jgi:2,4-dienoyl-CoA reductase-like NADH-dependent reductase (Old Yellow Enzyme family)
VRLGPVTLRNRIVKAATFEGRSRKNQVTDELIAFHREVAAGGVGMTTLAFCAVSRDGRGASGELHLDRDAVPGLRRLVDDVHDEGAAASVQLGHAGPTASATGQRGVAPSPIFSPMAMRRTRPASDGDIARITDDFANAARCAVEAGFDAVEIHVGHGYLLSSFLSPRTNRRTDQWGGSVENRARFPRQVLRAVHDAVGDRAAVIAKLNMADGVRGGLWLEDSVEVGRLIEADGSVDALQLTGGSTFLNPMYLFRGDAPVDEMAAMMPQPMKLGIQLIGRRFFIAYPFEEAYFLPYARQFREALDLPLMLLGGIDRLETIELALSEGFEFVAMARALLREPDLVNSMRAGRTADSLCVHCNKCMPTIYTGTRCVLR